MLKEFAEYLKPLKSKYKITLEMGRYIAATCGVYVSSVADTKTNKGQNYCIIDGGINHVNYYGQTTYTFVKADGTAAAGYGAKDYGTELKNGQYVVHCVQLLM